MLKGAEIVGRNTFRLGRVLYKLYGKLVIKWWQNPKELVASAGHRVEPPSWHGWLCARGHWLHTNKCPTGAANAIHGGRIFGKILGSDLGMWNAVVEIGNVDVTVTIRVNAPEFGDDIF